VPVEQKLGLWEPMLAVAYSAVMSRGFSHIGLLSSAWTRATYHYRFGRREQAALRERIREVAETRMRCGYRGIAVPLRREGWRVNVKRRHRLYRLEGLQIRLKPSRRRVMAKLRDEQMPVQPCCLRWRLQRAPLMTLARRFKVHARSVALREFNSGGL
jgi:hypothetical protein